MISSTFSNGFSLFPSINLAARIAIRVCPTVNNGSNNHQISRTRFRRISYSSSKRQGTSIAAELLDWGETAGAVEVGKWADLVAVSNDPLKDITELQKVKFVMKGGAIFKDELRK